MKQGFRQSMAWLHTWTGLLVGWVLLLIFMAGTASYYRAEIGRWMRPEMPRSAPVEPARAVAAAQDYLQARAADARSWTIILPTAREPVMSLYWRNPDPPPGSPPMTRDQMFGHAIVDPATGRELAARDTEGGDFFYRLHFDLHYIPVLWARYFVGFCAMFMLVAIISGVITHKKIFKDFFTFRPGKGQRSWLDFHNVSAVMALPYHAMITYTGIVTLMLMYLPLTVKAAYPQGPDAFYDDAFGRDPVRREASGTPARPQPLAMLLQTAQRQLGGSVSRVSVENPGDDQATASFAAGNDGRLSTFDPSVVLDAVRGNELGRSERVGGGSQTRGVMVGLHRADFASPLLRLLFFGSGLLGCLMVASGVILWAIKERPKHQKAGRIGFGLRLVDALNIGNVAGLPIAFAAYFWANRLLPVGIAARPDLEIRAFFLTWLAALLAAFAWPRRMMWSWQLYLSGAAFAAIPLLNALTTDAHLGVSVPAGDWVLAGFDLVCLAMGLCLLLAARRMQRWAPPVSAAARRRARETTAAPATLAGEPAE